MVICIYIYVYGHLQLTKSGENTKLRTSTVLDEIDGLVGSWEPAEIQMGSHNGIHNGYGVCYKDLQNFIS